MLSPRNIALHVFVDDVNVIINEIIKKEITGDKRKEYLLKRLSCRYGGLSFYIPKGYIRRTQRKKARLKKEFNGSNHNQLAVKYKLSVQRVYEILREDTNA
ncbi:Mor transcription activator family protein [Pasteurella atlantica]|uniref:Mor transcription activator family protein n=1 Tax=Pasteurellaceae TaxID=712 RepID=UPI0027663E22|nr:Mor transcription activator family protein [Pasteurella atlantica]MDP8098535.1 Mor transcription activator family protein [Pasteurella atlantica]MDP8106773.1 Mor transcription activator family protein [Pasteurella atlantica]MDP8116464.1 Mor transcription activator family protein [Pasteurella atlantica]